MGYDGVQICEKSVMTKLRLWQVMAVILFALASCKKDDHGGGPAQKKTITVTNVLDSRPLVESGTFQGTGSPALILPGQSVTITFSAAKGEVLTFATMYGWS